MAHRNLEFVLVALAVTLAMLAVIVTAISVL